MKSRVTPRLPSRIPSDLELKGIKAAVIKVWWTRDLGRVKAPMKEILRVLAQIREQQAVPEPEHPTPDLIQARQRNRSALQPDTSAQPDKTQSSRPAKTLHPARPAKALHPAPVRTRYPARPAKPRHASNPVKVLYPPQKGVLCKGTERGPCEYNGRGDRCRRCWNDITRENRRSLEVLSHHSRSSSGQSDLDMEALETEAAESVFSASDAESELQRLQDVMDAIALSPKKTLGLPTDEQLSADRAIINRLTDFVRSAVPEPEHEAAMLPEPEPEQASFVVKADHFSYWPCLANHTRWDAKRGVCNPLLPDRRPGPVDFHDPTVFKRALHPVRFNADGVLVWAHSVTCASAPNAHTFYV